MSGLCMSGLLHVSRDETAPLTSPPLGDPLCTEAPIDRLGVGMSEVHLRPPLVSETALASPTSSPSSGLALPCQTTSYSSISVMLASSSLLALMSTLGFVAHGSFGCLGQAMWLTYLPPRELFFGGQTSASTPRGHRGGYPTVRGKPSCVALLICNTDGLGGGIRLSLTPPQLLMTAQLLHPSPHASNVSIMPPPHHLLLLPPLHSGLQATTARASPLRKRSA
jgi:hypothetical protein